MRYIDTGSRDPEHALGAWLAKNAGDDASVADLRWQTGFFGSAALGYLAPLMGRLAAMDGVLRVLVGSNEGATVRSDIERLLAAAGAPRERRQIGIVKFDSGFFHPKTIHVTRADGSAAAYVGSANLTQSGVTSLHVEAGILLDTNDGDDSAVIARIADAVDWWFAEAPSGLTVVNGPEDLSHLVEIGILNVPRPAKARPSTGDRGKARGAGVHLTPLVTAPPLPADVAAAASGSQTTEDAPDGETASAEEAQPPVAPAATATWQKRLTRSDAQRKATGNQRGSITLVAAGQPIDGQTYFRYDLFANADWQSESTRTGEPREVAVVPFRTRIGSSDLGMKDISVSYAPNREAGQANYTSLLHLGPLSEIFGKQDMTGRLVRLERKADGSYELSIS